MRQAVTYRPGRPDRIGKSLPAGTHWTPIPLLKFPHLYHQNKGWGHHTTELSKQEEAAVAVPEVL